MKLKKNIWSNRNFHAQKITLNYLGRSTPVKFKTYKINFVNSITLSFVDVQSYEYKYYSSNNK